MSRGLACRNADISTMELVFPVYSAHASSSLLAIYVPLCPFSPNPAKKNQPLPFNGSSHDNDLEV